MMISVLDQVENIVGEAENACDQYFLLFFIITTLKSTLFEGL